MIFRNYIMESIGTFQIKDYCVLNGIRTFIFSISIITYANGKTKTWAKTDKTNVEVHTIE